MRVLTIMQEPSFYQNVSRVVFFDSVVIISFILYLSNIKIGNVEMKLLQVPLRSPIMNACLMWGKITPLAFSLKNFCGVFTPYFVLITGSNSRRSHFQSCVFNKSCPLESSFILNSTLISKMSCRLVLTNGTLTQTQGVYI